MIRPTIWHNPSCGTSRNTLALMRAAGPEPDVVDYLRDPPAPEALAAMLAAAGLTAADALRRKGAPEGIDLDDPALDETARIALMCANPILINRPFVATDRGARLCRPSDLALDLLPNPPFMRLLKEEGLPFLRDAAVPAEDREVAALLGAAGLPREDLASDGTRYLLCRDLAGGLVGCGGFAVFGPDALIRSVAVAPGAKGNGRNLLALLLARARAAGARRAWLLTTTAEGFFARAGFRAAPRDAAPPAVAATRQARLTCPAAAVLMTRTIGF